MPVRFEFEGLEELREALRRLPDELADDAGAIASAAAEGAKNDIIDQYPSRTGNLRRGVRIDRQVGRAGVQIVVSNRAPHAAIYEFGTQARHTDLGVNRGSMPPGNVFIPAMMRRRRQMYHELKALLVEHGLSVSGDA